MAWMAWREMGMDVSVTLLSNISKSWHIEFSWAWFHCCESEIIGKRAEKKVNGTAERKSCTPNPTVTLKRHKLPKPSPSIFPSKEKTRTDNFHSFRYGIKILKKAMLIHLASEVGHHAKSLGLERQPMRKQGLGWTFLVPPIKNQIRPSISFTLQGPKSAKACYIGLQKRLLWVMLPSYTLLFFSHQNNHSPVTKTTL